MSSTSVKDDGSLARFGLVREESEEEWEPREERRSPAAVFGSKRVGLEIIPEGLEERIKAEIAGKLSPIVSIPLPPPHSPTPLSSYWTSNVGGDWYEYLDGDESS